MENNKTSKADLLSVLSASFAALKDERAKGKYTPDPEELAAMARRIAAKTHADPTRLASETLDDLLA